MYLYHVSLIPVTEFIPRIPTERAHGEDKNIYRICIAPSIENCINAMPGGASSISILKELGITPILFIYEFKLRVNAKGLRYPHDISKMVPDADTTHEYWLTEKPTFVQEYVFQVEQITTKPHQDLLQRWIYPIVQIQYSPVSVYKDNITALREKYVEYPDVLEKVDCLLQRYGIRTLLWNMYDMKMAQIRKKEGVEMNEKDMVDITLME